MAARLPLVPGINHIVLANGTPDTISLDASFFEPPAYACPAPASPTANPFPEDSDFGRAWRSAQLNHAMGD